MKIPGSGLLIVGMLVFGLIGLLQSQPILSLPDPAQPNVSENAVPSYQGSWVGTFAFVGGSGEMLMFVDPSGKISGSLASTDSDHFAQLSGSYKGDAFHIGFTPPSGTLNQYGGDEAQFTDATATWEQGGSRLILSSPGGTDHPESYRFERMPTIDR